VPNFDVYWVLYVSYVLFTLSGIFAYSVDYSW
jgi:hypothetical protein